MFSAVRNEVSSRLRAADLLLSAVDGIEKAGAPSASTARDAKGLMFVQLYAVYEYCVTNSVRAAVTTFNALGIGVRDVRTELLAMILDSQCSSLVDSPREDPWGKRCEIFVRSRDPGPAAIRDTLFPKDNSHFRADQLRTIWKVFGLSSAIVPDSRLIGRIDELVATRNDVAHGRASPADVGQRFSVNDLRTRIKDVNAICFHIVAELELHSSKKAHFTAA